MTEIEKEKEKQKIFPVLCTYISHLLYLYKEVEIIRCFDMVFKRPYPYFSKALKVTKPCLIAIKFSPGIDYRLKFVKMKVLVKSILL